MPSGAAKMITALAAVQEAQRIGGNVAEIGVYSASCSSCCIYSRERTRAQSRLICLRIIHETSAAAALAILICFEGISLGILICGVLLYITSRRQQRARWPGAEESRERRVPLISIDGGALRAVPFRWHLVNRIWHLVQRM